MDKKNQEARKNAADAKFEAKLQMVKKREEKEKERIRKLAEEQDKKEREQVSARRKLKMAKKRSEALWRLIDAMHDKKEDECASEKTRCFKQFTCLCGNK